MFTRLLIYITVTKIENMRSFGNLVKLTYSIKSLQVGLDAFHDIDRRSTKMNFGDINYKNNVQFLFIISTYLSISIIYLSIYVGINK